MKNITKYIMGVCLSSMSLLNTSCIEEVFPNDGVTEDQLQTSPKAVEAMLWGIPAYVNNFGVLGTTDPEHYDFGYGAIMHIRDLMTEDMAISSNYANWWMPWYTNQSLGESYLYAQFIWNYYYKFIQTSNKLIGAINEENATDTEKGYLGVAYTFRAMQYLDLAQMFEFLPSDAIPSSVNAAGKDVSGLTVPIVTEKTTEQESGNNPRVTREKMAEFILENLNKAEEYIGKLTITSKMMPHLDVVYGLKARCYMWLQDYGNARIYARQAINTTKVVPMSQEEWLSPTTGFNDSSTWMWASEVVKESDVVQTGVVNWTSWMCNETTFGYCGAGGSVMIGASLYDRISNSDFRKLAFKAPEGSLLEGQNSYNSASIFKAMPDYASLKFRPNGGNVDEYQVGAVAAYPLMRVEEMYFIEAEAAAHLNESEGAALLKTFMTTYRDRKFVQTNSVIDEIILQKRIELWGEGLTLFDVKRLDMSVKRGYNGTNFFATSRLNTEGRPAWMSFCIVQTEKNNNKALVGYENPDPSSLYSPWTGQ